MAFSFLALVLCVFIFFFALCLCRTVYTGKSMQWLFLCWVSILYTVWFEQSVQDFSLVYVARLLACSGKECLVEFV